VPTKITPPAAIFRAASLPQMGNIFNPQLRLRQAIYFAQINRIRSGK
jgi:hypothetical protein